MKLDAAFKTAESLVEYLRPGCTRIEIAGSVRRGKPEVKDIEIVCIPDLSLEVPRARAEFGQPIPAQHKTMLDKLVWEMADVTVEANGARMKKLYLSYAGIRCDLFIVLPPAQWGVQMVIRTGPKDFGHWCVTKKKYGGALPNWFFVKHGVVWDQRQISRRQIGDNPENAIPLLNEWNHIEQPEEIHFLNLLGVGWIEPGERVARWNR